jgi:hypothetical protein
MAPLSVPPVTVFSGYPGNRKSRWKLSVFYIVLLSTFLFKRRKIQYSTVQYMHI